MSTAIQGSGIDAAKIASEIHPLCQTLYAQAAPSRAGNRNAISVK